MNYSYMGLNFLTHVRDIYAVIKKKRKNMIHVPSIRNIDIVC